MCKGLALGLSKELKLKCKGLSSHTGSGFDNGEYLKLELIINDTKPEGYELLVDTENDDEICAMFIIDGKLKAETYSFIIKEIKKKEVEYLRFLLKNMSYAEAGKNQDMSGCKAVENQDMSSCGARENQYMRGCKAGENQYMSYCEAKKRIISYMKSANPENNEFIRKLSDEAEGNKLDWDYLVELARKGYEKK